jgi:hypothetical protein
VPPVSVPSGTAEGLRRSVCSFGLRLKVRFPPGPTIASVIALVVLCVGFPDHARAQAVLTFAAKRAEDALGIPHSYLRITGTTESGEGIHRTFGYMPVEQSSFLALGDRVRGAVIDEPEAGIEWDRVTPFLSVQVPDKTLDAVIVRFRYWNENRNGGYDAYSQNCIAFLADIARTAGLRVPPGSHLSPSGFLSELAELNPPGTLPGILTAPVANPAPADQPDANTPDTPAPAPPDLQASVP